MSDIVTKTEGYVLPSKGLIYGKEFDPHVQLRSMTTMDELARTSPTNTPYKNISDLIERCLITKLPISVYDMHIGDYEFLYQKLRVVSYGPEYKSITMCSKCGEIISKSYNLDELKTVEFSNDDFQKRRIVELPVSKKKVVVNFQTPRILDRIKSDANEMRKNSKDSKKNFELITSLKWAIDTVDGMELGLVEKEEFVKNLPIRDMNLILNRVQKLNQMIGLDTRVHITCDKCGEDILTFFRFGPEFLRPDED